MHGSSKRAFSKMLEGDDASESDDSDEQATKEQRMRAARNKAQQKGQVRVRGSLTPLPGRSFLAPNWTVWTALLPVAR